MIKIVLVAIFVLGLNLFGSREAIADSSIQLNTLENFRPFVWCERGLVKGIDADVVVELFKRIGRELTIQCLPWKRALSETVSGKSDGTFPGYKTNEREEFAYFPSAPLHYSTFKVFVKSGNEFPFDSIEDLFGKKIGLIAGFAISPAFDEAKRSGKFNIEEAAEPNQSLKMLLRGRIDAYVEIEQVGMYYAKQLEIQDQITVLATSINMPSPAGVMISKAANIQNKSWLLESLSQTLNQMWLDGRIEEISRRYTQ